MLVSFLNLKFLKLRRGRVRFSDAFWSEELPGEINWPTAAGAACFLFWQKPPFSIYAFVSSWAHPHEFHALTKLYNENDGKVKNKQTNQPPKLCFYSPLKNKQANKKTQHKLLNYLWIRLRLATYPVKMYTVRKACGMTESPVQPG